MQSWIDKIQRGQFDVIWWNWLNKSFDRVIGRMGIEEPSPTLTVNSSLTHRQTPSCASPMWATRQ